MIPLNYNFDLVLAFIPIYNSNNIITELIAGMQEHGNIAQLKWTGNKQKPSDNHTDFQTG